MNMLRDVFGEETSKYDLLYKGKSSFSLIA